jgi:hypothetical protein
MKTSGNVNTSRNMIWAKLAEIDAKKIPYWIPPHRMMNVESDTDPWGDKWRAGT